MNRTEALLSRRYVPLKLLDTSIYTFFVLKQNLKIASKIAYKKNYIKNFLVSFFSQEDE